MTAQKMAGLFLITLGLLECIFAKYIFKFATQIDGSKIMHFERWPSWMFPTWIWMMRIGGLLIVTIGVMMYMKNN